MLGIYRVLGKGGKFYISVPDMDVLFKKFTDKNSDTRIKIDVIRMIFGGQTDQYDFHYFGWDFLLLSGLLKNVGFKDIEKVKSNYCEEDPADCTCMGLFAIALKNTARVERSTAYLPTEGYRTGSLARCRCYLYVAAAAGFNSIALENEVEECNGKYEISESKSYKLCK